MSLKNILKSNPVIYGLYKKWKKKRIERAKKNNLKCRKVFIDRSKGKEKLCVILAGYKEFLYPAVTRIELIGNIKRCGIIYPPLVHRFFLHMI